MDYLGTMQKVRKTICDVQCMPAGAWAQPERRARADGASVMF
jgi:hypothetical protein